MAKMLYCHIMRTKLVNIRTSNHLHKTEKKNKFETVRERERKGVSIRKMMMETWKPNEKQMDIKIMESNA